jgi:hypothetical protein
MWYVEKARCRGEKNAWFFQPSTHSLKKFDDFGIIIIKVAVCVPVRFSEQYAWNGKGSFWLSPGAFPFIICTKNRDHCRPLPVMTSK